jgi:hypothetical protein
MNNQNNNPALNGADNGIGEEGKNEEEANKASEEQLKKQQEEIERIATIAAESYAKALEEMLNKIFGNDKEDEKGKKNDKTEISKKEISGMSTRTFAESLKKEFQTKLTQWLTAVAEKNPELIKRLTEAVAKKPEPKEQTQNRNNTVPNTANTQEGAKVSKLPQNKEGGNKTIVLDKVNIPEYSDPKFAKGVSSTGVQMEEYAKTSHTHNRKEEVYRTLDMEKLKNWYKGGVKKNGGIATGGKISQETYKKLKQAIKENKGSIIYKKESKIEFEKNRIDFSKENKTSNYTFFNNNDKEIDVNKITKVTDKDVGLSKVNGDIAKYNRTIQEFKNDKQNDGKNGKQEATYKQELATFINVDRKNKGGETGKIYSLGKSIQNEDTSIYNPYFDKGGNFRITTTDATFHSTGVVSWNKPNVNKGRG